MEAKLKFLKINLPKIEMNNLFSQNFTSLNLINFLILNVSLLVINIIFKYYEMHKIRFLKIFILSYFIVNFYLYSYLLSKNKYCMYRYINLVFLVLLYALFQISNKDNLKSTFNIIKNNDENKDIKLESISNNIKLGNSQEKVNFFILIFVIVMLLNNMLHFNDPISSSGIQLSFKQNKLFFFTHSFLLLTTIGYSIYLIVKYFTGATFYFDSFTDNFFSVYIYFIAFSLYYFKLFNSKWIYIFCALILLPALNAFFYIKDTPKPDKKSLINSYSLSNDYPSILYNEEFRKNKINVDYPLKRMIEKSYNNYNIKANASQEIYDKKSEDSAKIKPPQPIPEATLPEDFGDLENIKMNPLLQDEFFDLLEKKNKNEPVLLHIFYSHKTKLFVSFYLNRVEKHNLKNQLYNLYVVFNYSWYYKPSKNIKILTTKQESSKGQYLVISNIYKQYQELLQIKDFEEILIRNYLRSPLFNNKIQNVIFSGFGSAGSHAQYSLNRILHTKLTNEYDIEDKYNLFQLYTFGALHTGDENFTKQINNVNHIIRAVYPLDPYPNLYNGQLMPTKGYYPVVQNPIEIISNIKKDKDAKDSIFNLHKIYKESINNSSYLSVVGITLLPNLLFIFILVVLYAIYKIKNKK